MKYQVIDRQTNEIVGTRKSRTSARKLRDKKDLEYGCYNYYVKEVCEE